MRAVLDVNVIISGLLSPRGAPARVLTTWLEGGYDLVVSPLLLEELERALGHPKLRKRVSEAEAREVLELVRREAELPEDSPAPPSRTADPGDDYVITLAAETQSVIVSGDRHLLDMRRELPVYTAAEFLSLVEDNPDSYSSRPWVPVLPVLPDEGPVRVPSTG